VHDYPQAIAPIGHIEPVPRRIRGLLGGHVVFDTTHALYVWEWRPYPQYYIPLADVNRDVLVDEQYMEHLERGTVAHHGLHAGGVHRLRSARVYTAHSQPKLVDTVRFEWSALDAWYEEDERIHTHPRNPYARVDALRSTRELRIELDGVELARSRSPVMVFETGLPPRFYVNPTEVDLDHLLPSDTVTACPYKGVTSAYWSARIGDAIHPDVAWSYAFPTRQLQPIAGLIAFFDERVDVIVDGVLRERPRTPFSE
jgi:uncharacterized protein (DUF427 family)